MGLDMYLNRMPRYKDVTPKQISVVEDYFDWISAKKENKTDCSFKEWCGHDENELPNQEIIEHFKPFYTKRYSAWDTEHKYGYWCIMDQVGYWRKANQIHNWFVEHAQNGIDDCDYHNEITKEMLELLRSTCKAVIKASKLINGKIKNGYTFDKNGNRIYNYEDGLIVENPSVAEKLLPTTNGFFFGGTTYDEYYINDLKETVEIINKILAETDFETQMIYYVSSW